MLCYLDALTEDSGALQVIPGSHHHSSDGGMHESHTPEDLASAQYLTTSPGDLLVLDEHLLHASSGGEKRIQWRVDFVSDSGEETDLVRYFADQHVVGWDGGYDVDLFPSYGPAWRDINADWTRRLKELGVFELADAEEQSVREKRQRHTD